MYRSNIIKILCGGSQKYIVTSPPRRDYNEGIRNKPSARASGDIRDKTRAHTRIL